MACGAACTETVCENYLSCLYSCTFLLRIQGACVWVGGCCTSRNCAVQALESLLNNYKARHVECMHGTMMPGKYIVVEMWDEYAGLGNQFPSIITGAPEGPFLLEALQNLVRHCMTLLSL